MRRRYTKRLRFKHPKTRRGYRRNTRRIQKGG